MHDENAIRRARAPVIQSERLVLSELDHRDAPFIIELVNDPAWLEHIGDRNVRDDADAHRYINEGPRDSYRRHGFGLWRVARKHDDTPLGLCGLLKRDTLEAPDLGFAFLPAARGHGYAFEAAAATLVHARDALQLPRVLAIVSTTNSASIALLAKLGFTREKSLPTVAAKQTDLFALML